jgi:hypothetical protein
MSIVTVAPWDCLNSCFCVKSYLNKTSPCALFALSVCVLMSLLAAPPPHLSPLGMGVSIHTLARDRFLDHPKRSRCNAFDLIEMRVDLIFFQTSTAHQQTTICFSNFF